MKTTRQEILDYLHTKDTASAAQISQALRMTAANARHHLGNLVSEGAVVVIGERPGSGRGRPVRLYGLSEPTMRHNLDKLVAILLTLSVSGKEPDEIESFLRAIAAQIAGETPLRRNPTQRLNQAVQRLNELNYHAAWEAFFPAPRVIFGHCPYRLILSEHPEICRVDAEILRNLLGAPVTQTARLIPGASGLPQCIFLLNQRF